MHQKDKIYERIAMLKSRKAELDSETLKLFNAFCDTNCGEDDGFIDVLFPILAPTKIGFEDLYEGVFSSFIHFILDDEYASIFYSYLHLEENSSCVRYPLIKPMRNKRPVVHAIYINIAITNFFYLNAYGWSERQLFIDESSKETSALPELSATEWLAGRIYQNDQQIIDRLFQSLIDGSWTERWRTYFLWAISLSGNQKLIDQLCNILGNEAYRGMSDDVVRALCDGHANCMLTLLHFTLDSYLKNGDWMLNGVYDDFVINEIFHKFGLDYLPIEEEYNALTLLIGCLESEIQRNEALSSDVFLNTYIGLATTAFYNGELVWDKANQFNNEESEMHIKAALFYYSHTWTMQAYHVLSTRVMEKWSHNLSVMAYAVPGFMNRIDMTRRWKEIHMCDISEFLCTEDDLRKMYYFFKDLLSNLPPKLTYQEMTAYWEYKKLTRSEVIAKMAAIVWFLDDKKLKDDVIDFIDQSECIGVFIKLCLGKPRGKKQLRFLIQSLGCRREDARCWAYSIVKNLKLSSKEMDQIKKLQKSKYIKTRQMVKEIEDSQSQIFDFSHSSK